VIERVFARQMPGDIWQWRLSDAEGGWSDAFSTGDNEALREVLPSTTTPVCVVISGQTVVATEAYIPEKDRRHIAKLLPFELEEDLIDSIDGMHFSYGEVVEDKASVLYARNESVGTPVNQLADLGCDVFHALPDYLLLQRPEVGATILLDEGMVYVRLSKYEGFSIDEEVAESVLRRLTQEYNDSATIQLVGTDEVAVKKLKQWLPDAWTAESGPRLQGIRGGFWDWIDTALEAEELNMRRGKYARRLPLDRWIGLWKKPAIFVGIAVVLALAVNVSAYLFSKAEDKELRAEISRVYLDAVPNGRRGDPEGNLRSLVKGAATNEVQPTNFLFLLSKVAEAMAKHDKVTVNNFSYNGQQRHLQVTMEVKNIGDLTAFRDELGKIGIAADSPRTNRLGDKYQARMKLTEAGQ